jgi:uncharacterized protein (TIGR03083 family)
VATLREVGPGKPTLCAGWTTTELAAHLASGESLRGWLAFPGRLVIAATPVRLTGLNARVGPTIIRGAKKRGFDWALRVLSSPSPRLLAVGPAGPVALAELFVHHEDIRRANGYPPRADSELPDLTPARDFLTHYQRGQAASLAPPATLSMGDTVLWLAGRSDDGPPLSI